MTIAEISVVLSLKHENSLVAQTIGVSRTGVNNTSINKLASDKECPGTWIHTNGLINQDKIAWCRSRAKKRTRKNTCRCGAHTPEKEDRNRLKSASSKNKQM